MCHAWLQASQAARCECVAWTIPLTAAHDANLRSRRVGDSQNSPTLLTPNVPATRGTGGACSSLTTRVCWRLEVASSPSRHTTSRSSYILRGLDEATPRPDTRFTNPLIVRLERDHHPESVSTASRSALNTEAARDGRIVEGSDAGSCYSHGQVPACTPTRTASACNGLLGAIEHQSKKSQQQCSLPHLCSATQRRALSGRASRCRESLSSCDTLQEDGLPEQFT